MALIFDRQPGMVAYVTCGDPDVETTKQIVLAAARAGADVIELGIPFSDPVADGPVIQRASERALQSGTTLQRVVEMAGELRQQTNVGLMIFSYMNPVLRFGLARFCTAAQVAGIDGALITDLPVEEAGDYQRCMSARNLATIFLAAPTSTDERLRKIAEASSGFIYAVSRTGVTGARAEVSQDARDLVHRLRRHTQLPIAVGFGISTPEQFASVGEYADAAVVGSAIVQIIEQQGRNAAPAVEKFVAKLKGSQAAKA